jgi:hypothetical protein
MATCYRLHVSAWPSLTTSTGSSLPSPRIARSTAPEPPFRLRVWTADVRGRVP